MSLLLKIYSKRKKSLKSNKINFLNQILCSEHLYQNVTPKYLIEQLVSMSNSLISFKFNVIIGQHDQWKYFRNSKILFLFIRKIVLQLFSFFLFYSFILQICFNKINEEIKFPVDCFNAKNKIFWR